MKVILVLLCLLVTGQCSNILGLFSHTGKSHHTLGEMLFRSLASKGHQVTMVSPYPLKEQVKNYRDIDSFETRIDMESRNEKGFFKNITKQSISFNSFTSMIDMTLSQSELLFVNKEFQSLVNSGVKFDLIIMDWFFNEAQLAYSHIFNCPVIIIASSGSSAFSNYVVGNPAPWSYVPTKYFTFTDNMNFFQRVINTIMNFTGEVVIYIAKMYQQNIINKYVADAPNIERLLNNVALVLSNGHYSFESPRPFVPNFIDVGGFHIKSVKNVTGKIGKFLDEAKEGAIFFSLGSHMKSVYLGQERIQGIINAFSKLKVKVIWKFEDENVQNLPKNVMVSNWLSQNDVLAHPNMKLFITHGGMLSIIESIYHAVPMIGIPMFGDQNHNVPNIVKLGFARQILSKDINEANLFENIMKILNNKSYSYKVKLHSELLKNQASHPMDRAIYWVEHVIKHKGAEHLKNGSMKLYWFQNLLFDVFSFIFIIVTIVIMAVFFSLRFILRKVFKRKPCVKSDKKKNNKLD